MPTTAANRPLRVLLVEDSERDAELLSHELRRAGLKVISERVDTPADMEARLEQGGWDLVNIVRSCLDEREVETIPA